MKEKLRHIFLVLTAAEKRQFWIQIFLNIIISITDVASLALLLLVINFYISNAADSRLGFLPEWMLDRDSAILVAFFFIVFSIKNLLGILISSAQYKFNSQVAVRISLNKLTNYQQSEFSEFINIDSSSHIRKIAMHPFEFCQHVLSGMQQVIIQSMLILLTITAIILYNAQLFLLILVMLLPPVIFVFFYIRKQMAATRKNIHSSNERSYQYLLDALKGYVEGNIYQRNNFFLDRFNNARQEFSRHLFNSISVQNMPNRIIETFAVLGLFVLIVIAKWTHVNDSSALITLGAFMAAAYKIIPGLVKVINSYGLMRTYDSSVTELETPKREKDINVKQAEPFQTLDLKNINFQYGDHCVLNKFSLSIKKGDFIGITGKSGKGKTTILNLMLGFITPTEGGVFINDRSILAAEIKSYWPYISYVRQQAFLIHDTISRNITLQEKGYNDERLKMTLSVSGLTDLIEQSPEGLAKMIAENGRNISGGQQQRIAIARALYKDAELILLDEPFNELDEASTTCLVKHFQQMAATGKAIVMITHDTKCLSFCNKVVSLNQ